MEWRQNLISPAPPIAPTPATSSNPNFLQIPGVVGAEEHALQEEQVEWEDAADDAPLLPTPPPSRQLLTMVSAMFQDCQQQHQSPDHDSVPTPTAYIYTDRDVEAATTIQVYFSGGSLDDGQQPTLTLDPIQRLAGAAGRRAGLSP